MPAPVKDLDEWKRVYGDETPTIDPASDAAWVKRIEQIKADTKKEPEQ